MVSDNNVIEEILKRKITERTFSGIPSPDIQDQSKGKTGLHTTKKPSAVCTARAYAQTRLSIYKVLRRARLIPKNLNQSKQELMVQVQR